MGNTLDDQENKVVIEEIDTIDKVFSIFFGLSTIFILGYLLSYFLEWQLETGLRVFFWIFIAIGIYIKGSTYTGSFSDFWAGAETRTGGVDGGHHGRSGWEAMGNKNEGLVSNEAMTANQEKMYYATLFGGIIMIIFVYFYF